MRVETDKHKLSLAKRKKRSSADYQNPRPNTRLMKFMGPLNRRFMLHGIPVLRRLPILSRIPFIRGFAKIEHIDLPHSDLQQLKGVVNQDTASFITPNHPEYLSDWFLDKEVAELLAPEAASFADQDILTGALKNFWLAQNLIGSRGGERARDYAIETALQGKSVLLHPEGQVHWTANQVHSLFPGAAEMALGAAKQAVKACGAKAVFLVPVIYKYRFTKSIAKHLAKEMQEIEQRLALPQNSGLSIELRFAALQRNILSKQEQKFGLHYKQAVCNAKFFERQTSLKLKLVETLRESYHCPTEDTLKQLYYLETGIREVKSSNPEVYRRDREILEEVRRLNSFSEEIYGVGETISQEEMAESLKRIKRDLFRGRRFDAIHKLLPIPLGPRCAHIRAASAIEVQASSDAKELTKALQKSMSRGLKTLLKEIEGELNRYAVANPFYSGE